MQNKEADLSEVFELIAMKAQEVTKLRQAHMEEIYNFWLSVRADKSVPSTSWCRRQFDMYLLRIYGGGPFTTFPCCHINRIRGEKAPMAQHWQAYLDHAHATVLQCDALPKGSKMARLESILSTSGTQYVIFAWRMEDQSDSDNQEATHYLKGVFDDKDAFQIIEWDCDLDDPVVIEALQLKRLVGGELNHSDLVYSFLTDYPSKAHTSLAAQEKELRRLTELLVGT